MFIQAHDDSTSEDPGERERAKPGEQAACSEVSLGAGSSVGACGAKQK